MGGGNEDSETQAKDTEKNIDDNGTPDVSRRESPDNPPETPTFGELNLAFKANGVNRKPRSNLVSGANPSIQSRTPSFKRRRLNGSDSGQEASGLDKSNQSQSHTQHLNSFATDEVDKQLNRHIYKHQNRLGHQSGRVHTDLNAKHLGNKGMYTVLCRKNVRTKALFLRTFTENASSFS